MRLLWEICQVPDFRKVTPDMHAEMLGGFYSRLCDHGRLPEDWVAGHIKKLDRTDGDIETLTQRLAQIRTWAYVSHRASWMQDHDHWQERTREIEDSVSDALHEQLMQRFVDKRATLIGRKGGERAALLSSVNADGQVMLEGHVVGRIAGFRFQPDRAKDSREAKNLQAAAAGAMSQEMQRRTALLESAKTKDIRLNPMGRIVWQDMEIAYLRKGEDLLTPTVALTSHDIVDSNLQRRILKRLEDWLKGHLQRRFAALEAPKDCKLEASARGLLFQLREGLGSIPAKVLRDQLKELGAADRKILNGMGIRFGTQWIFIDRFLKPDLVRLRAILWAVHHECDIPAIPNKTKTSLPADHATREGWPVLGYEAKGPMALRQDRLEQVMAVLRARNKKAPFQLDGELARLIGCPEDQLPAVYRDLGVKKAGDAPDAGYRLKGRKPQKAAKKASKRAKMSQKAQNSPSESKGHRRKKKTMSESHSPFAALKELLEKQ